VSLPDKPHACCCCCCHAQAQENAKARNSVTLAELEAAGVRSAKAEQAARDLEARLAAAHAERDQAQRQLADAKVRQTGGYKA
jgi:hypothetical protein